MSEWPLTSLCGTFVLPTAPNTRYFENYRASRINFTGLDSAPGKRPNFKYGESYNPSVISWTGSDGTQRKPNFKYGEGYNPSVFAWSSSGPAKAPRTRYLEAYSKYSYGALLLHSHKSLTDFFTNQIQTSSTCKKG